MVTRKIRGGSTKCSIKLSASTTYTEVRVGIEPTIGFFRHPRWVFQRKVGWVGTTHCRDRWVAEFKIMGKGTG